MINQTPDFSDSMLLSVLALSKDAIAVYNTEELHIRFANDAMLKIWGKDRSVIGKTFEQAIPEIVGQPFTDLLKEVWRSGITHIATDTPADLIIGGTLKTSYFDFEYRAIKNDAGETICLLHSATDVSERLKAWQLVKEKEEREQVLNEELTATNEELTVANEELTAANEELLNTQEQLFIETKDKQEAIERLNANEENLRNTVKQAPVGMCIVQGDPLFIVEVNDSFLELIGKRREQFFDTPYWDVNAEAKAYYEPITDNVLATGESYYADEHEIMLMRQGKPEIVHVNFVYQPLKGVDGKPFAIMIVAIDITEQVLTRKKIEASEKHFRSLADIVPAKISNALPSGEVTFFNQHWLDYSGMNFEDLRDFGYHQMMHPDEISEFQLRLGEAAAKGLPLEMEMRFKDIDGNYRWHLNIASPVLDEKGSITMWVGSTTDIERIKEEEQRKNDFIGMVSHEMKTPLTSLNAYMQVLQGKARKTNDAFTIGALDKSVNQIKKMTTMINGFLNLSRSESGKILLDKQTFEMDALVRNIIEETLLSSPNHKITLIPCSPVKVYADIDKIGNVISNLLSNAIKYSPNNFDIEVQCEVKESKAQLSVKDNGMGIPSKDLDHVFDRYYRVEANHTHTISGFGIGLYLSAEIIERHEGKIWVDSELGKGSTFGFTLPIS